MKTVFTGSLAILLSATLSQAIPLTERKFTQVIKDVAIIDSTSHAAEAAKVNDVFKAPNLVRTGPGSRAELTAADDSITRVGANTVFSFSDSGRSINLDQGCVLFHSPHGKGGGVIKSGGASAAVTGTTLIVSAVPDTDGSGKNGFKVILLEGTGLVKLGNGRYHHLHSGEIIYLLPGYKDFGPIFNINLPRLVQGSTLINGYAAPLPSAPAIQRAIDSQLIRLANGSAFDTGKNADDAAKGTTTGNNGQTDSSTFQQSPTQTVLNDPSKGGPNFHVIGLKMWNYVDGDGVVHSGYNTTGIAPISTGNLNTGNGGSCTGRTGYGTSYLHSATSAHLQTDLVKSDLKPTLASALVPSR